MKKLNLKEKLILCFLVAIEAIFCFTPLGSIPIGPIVATLSMVPVIITSLTFGGLFGMLLGGIFAIFSFIYWSFIMPAYPTAFLFSPLASFGTYKGNFGSIIICFLPRILGGFLPSKFKNTVIASVVGSFTNTILVLLFIFIFFGKEYSAIAEKTIISVIGITVLTNGVPEAIICAIICPIVSKVLRKI